MHPNEILLTEDVFEGLAAEVLPLDRRYSEALLIQLARQNRVLRGQQ